MHFNCFKDRKCILFSCTNASFNKPNTLRYVRTAKRKFVKVQDYTEKYDIMTKNVSYKNAGKNKVTTLNITISDPEMDEFSLLGQEVVFYLNYGEI